tara:strand:- start:821 stop:2602 length:1782 start_codon:yes stop_codon:yes gene_type:complete
MVTDANFVVKKGLNVQDGDISIKGSNKELRFYEGSNYVGFEAPALSANKIWVLPASDGSTGQLLKTDGSGNLGWVDGGASVIGGLTDVTMDITNYTDGILIQTNSDGSAPTTGTLNAADGNVGIGKSVLSAITSADANVVIGKNAGPAITTGGFNVLLGENAGSQISTGHSNIALGRGANRFGNGTDNISLGTFSMMNADLTGIQNICIGYNAGNNITTGDYNVVLGNADVASATGNHQLSISSNDATSPVTWITGDSSGVVNIPGSLTVAGSAVGGIASLAADTTPQLGGDLDVNGNELVSTSNADISITPNGTGKVIIGSITSQHDSLGKLTVKGTDASFLLEKHDDGASGGPTLSLYRYSASVADSDLIGQVNFRGEGSTGNPSTYISLRTEIEDTTEGSKDGKLIVRGLKANSQTDFMSVGSTGVEFEGGAKVGDVTDVTIGSGTSGTTTGFRLGANQEAGMVAGEVSSQSTANDGYIELMNMDLDSLTGSSGLQTIELTVQIEDETNEEVESFKALVQASEKTVLGTTARAVNFTEWAILFDGAARIGTLVADYDSSDDTIRIRYQNKQGSTATLTATFYAITMQNNT